VGPEALHSCPEVVRLVARFPLDVAADARDLFFGQRLSYEHEIERATEIAAGHRLAVPGPAVVELTAIDKPPLGIEDVNVRCARGVICLGHFLRVIETDTGTCSRPSSFSAAILARLSSGYLLASLALMATTATPLFWYSRPSSASSWRICFTYGQWLQMNSTNKTGAVLKSSIDIVRPSVSGRRNGGAFVPRGIIVEGVSTMTGPYRAIVCMSRAAAPTDVARDACSSGLQTLVGSKRREHDNVID